MNINDIHKKLLNEMFNPNDMSWEYSQDFMKRLHKGKQIDNVGDEDDSDDEDGCIDPVEFMEELKRAVHEEDDEVEIEYASGEKIVLDINVAKHLLANTTAEQLVFAAENPTYMHELLRTLYDEIISIDKESAEEIKED